MRFVFRFFQMNSFSALAWNDSSNPSEERRVEEIHSISFRCPEKWNIKLLNIIMITYHCHLHLYKFVCVMCVDTLAYSRWIGRLTQSLMKRQHEMRSIVSETLKLFIHLSAQQNNDIQQSTPFQNASPLPLFDSDLFMENILLFDLSASQWYWPQRRR